jgi:uncharacterized delta-60 repeat protein
MAGPVHVRPTDQELWEIFIYYVDLGGTMKALQLLSVGLAEASPIAPNPVPRPSRFGLLSILMTFCLLFAFVNQGAATDGALDPTFKAGVGATQISCMRARINYSDGTNRFLIYGFFTSMNGLPCLSLARFSSTGDLDTSFNPPISGEVRNAYLYKNNADPNYGKILIGGQIVVGSGNDTYYNLARLNADGTVDNTFVKTFTSSGMLNGIGVQSDGKILVGGWSLQVSGDSSAAYYLLRLNSDGSVDSSYPKRSAPEGLINTISIINGDLVYDQASVLGVLPNINGPHTGYMVNFDNTGSLLGYLGDELFNGTISGSTWVNGKIIFYGDFTQVLGVPRNHIARLNEDASLDLSFDPGTGPNGGIGSILLQPDGKIVVAGGFTSFNGTPVGYLARLNTEGSVDPSFTISADNRIRYLGLVNGVGPELVVFGYFSKFNGTPRPGLAYLDSNYNLLSLYSGWTTANNAPATVYALAEQTDGKIWVGGDFSGVGGIFRRGLARLNADGSLDTSCNAGVDGVVKNISIQQDGKILIAGYFGEYRTSLARVRANGRLDSTFNPIVLKPDGSIANLSTVRVLDNGQIMVGGEFGSINGASRSIVARLNSDGTLDSSFTAQINIPGSTSTYGRRVAPVGSNYLVSGSYFDQNNASLYGFLTSLTNNGDIDSTFAPAAAVPNIQTMDGELDDMLLQPDGKIVACGQFTHIVGESPARMAIARFSPGGLLDNTFNTNLSQTLFFMDAMARQPNGKILVRATTGDSPNWTDGQVIRLNNDGSKDIGFSVGSTSGGHEGGWCILRLPTGRAIIGGPFTFYNGSPAGGIVRIFANPANFNPGITTLLLGK